MKKTILAAALAVAAVGAHAENVTLWSIPTMPWDHWFQFEAGVGVGMYDTQDGRWYQQGMPTSAVQNVNVAWSLGLTGHVLQRENWGVDWRAEYVNLGRAEAGCLCTSDADYNPNTHQAAPGAEPGGAFTGSGSSQGVVLSLNPYYTFYGVQVGPEVGAYIHHDVWNEYVQIFSPPVNVAIHTAYWSVAPVAGITVSSGRYSISYRHYFTDINERNKTYPPLWKDADVVMFKMRF
jgi:hypothetical protein